MAKQSKRVFLIIGAALLVISACQPAPTPPPTVSGPNYPLTLTSIAQTSVALTASVATMIPSDTPVALVSAVTPSASGSPAAPTATFTATLAIPASPAVPMVSVTTATNCRSGPGREYDLVGAADVGVSFSLIGKSTATNYWIIKLPDGRACWLWGQYAMVEGNVNSLPEYAIPATPLPLFGSVAGTITDVVGNPVPNVTVSTLVAGKTVTTGSDGRYSIDKLRAGTEFVTASSATLGPLSRTVNITPGLVSTADFVMISPILITDTPSSPANVVGRVLLNGRPAAGATILIPETAIQTVTDSNGWYGFNLGPGSFRILAQLGNARGGIEVALSANQTTVAPDIILLPR